MHIDPHGWLVTLPLAAAMLWLYSRPADHGIKEVWRELLRREAMGLAMIAPVDPDRDPGQTRACHHLMFWSALGLCGIAAVCSLAAFLGFI